MTMDLSFFNVMYEHKIVRSVLKTICAKKVLAYLFRQHERQEENQEK